MSQNYAGRTVQSSEVIDRPVRRALTASEAVFIPEATVDRKILSVRAVETGGGTASLQMWITKKGSTGTVDTQLYGPFPLGAAETLVESRPLETPLEYLPKGYELRAQAVSGAITLHVTTSSERRGVREKA